MTMLPWNESDQQNVREWIDPYLVSLDTPSAFQFKLDPSMPLSHLFHLATPWFTALHLHRVPLEPSGLLSYWKWNRQEFQVLTYDSLEGNLAHGLRYIEALIRREGLGDLSTELWVYPEQMGPPVSFLKLPDVPTILAENPWLNDAAAQFITPSDPSVNHENN
jgi:hypothetical protein